MTASSLRRVRWSGAVFVLLGGAVHLQQWLRVFRHQDIGPLFIANVIASIAVGTALLAFDDRRILVAGLALAVGSLVAIVASRTVGLFGFEATDYGTPEIEAIVLEALAIVALGFCLTCSRTSPQREPEAAV